jgi:hypothetical protein
MLALALGRAGAQFLSINTSQLKPKRPVTRSASVPQACGRCCWWPAGTGHFRDGSLCRKRLCASCAAVRSAAAQRNGIKHRFRASAQRCCSRCARPLVPAAAAANATALLLLLLRPLQLCQPWQTIPCGGCGSLGLCLLAAGRSLLPSRLAPSRSHKRRHLATSLRPPLHQENLQYGP